MSAKWKGAWHPLAERFPMLGEDELREMASSIAEHGQYVPCVMDADGLGLDGRNRVAACALAGAEPEWQTHDGEPIAFIVEVNAERRHLSTGQRAMAVAIGLADLGKRTNGRFKRGSVPDNAGSGVMRWKARVQEAGLILDHAPELADAVLTGDLALDAAHRQADEKRRLAEQIKALGGDLAALVDTGVIPLEEAERRAKEAERIASLKDDDLTSRVEAGTLSLDEAEAIAAQSRERLAVWAEQVRDALGVLSRMAGYPLPDGMSELLAEDELRTLNDVLGALDQKENA